MRGRRHKLQVSTFPFLAVLLCAMGSLILVLLVMDRKAHQAALARARHEADKVAEQRARTEDERQAETEGRKQQARAEWEKKRDALHSKLTNEQIEMQLQMRKVRDRLSEIAARLRYEQDTSTELRRKVQSERGKARMEQDLLGTLRSGAGQAEARSKESNKTLERMTRDLLLMEQALKDLKKAKKREQHTFSVVPYRGRRGENRRPIYVECTATGVIFHPERRAMTLSDRLTELRAEVERRIARQRQKLAASAKSNETNPYFLLLVRPDGIYSYLAFQSILRGLDPDFGYEFIDADWILDFPADDEQPTTQPWKIATKTPSAVPPSTAKRNDNKPRPVAAAPSARGGARGTRAGLGGGYGGGSGSSATGGTGSGTGGSGQGGTGGVPGGTGSSFAARGVAFGGPGGSGGTLSGNGGNGSGSVGLFGQTGGRGGSGTPGQGGFGGTGSPTGSRGVAFGGSGGTGSALGSNGNGSGSVGQFGQAGAGGSSGSGASGQGGIGGVPGGTGSSFAPRGVAFGGSGGTGSALGGNGNSSGGSAGSGLPGVGSAFGAGGSGQGGISGAGSPSAPRGVALGQAGGTGNGTGGTGNGAGGAGRPYVPGAPLTGGSESAGLYPPQALAPGTGVIASSGGGTSQQGASYLGGNGGGGPGANYVGNPAGGSPGGNFRGSPTAGPGPPGNGGVAASGGASAPQGNTGTSASQASGGSPGNGGDGGAPGDRSTSSRGGSGSAVDSAGIDPLLPRQPPAPRDPAASAPPNDTSPRPRKRTFSLGTGGGGDGDPSSDPPSSYATPSYQKPKPRKHAPMRSVWVHGGRDWFIFVECLADGVKLYPSEKTFPLAQAASRSADNPLAAAIKQMIARRQALRRPDDPPFYPQVRLLVRPQNVQAFLMVYPALETVPAPKSRQNLDDDDDVIDVINAANP